MAMRIDPFLVGMVAAVGLAFLVPGPGSDGGFLHPELLTKAGVALIFFLHGVALSFAAMRAGALRWRLHLVVQVCTFGLFPLMGFLLLKAIGPAIGPGLATGIVFLCALPSTVSSSVALTAAARGNVPAAVFNATLSSLLGVFLTPLWVGAMVAGGGRPIPLGRVMLDLVTWLVVPLAVGQMARPWLGAWAARNKRWIGRVDRGTILMLVYTSFCDSVTLGIWTGHGSGRILVTLAVSAGLFAAAMLSVGWTCDRLGFPVEDRIAAIFCGSKKTLASGVPMAQILFGPGPALGLILLPIMVYHPLQLVICGVLAGRWARRPDGARPDPIPTSDSVADATPADGSAGG